MKELFAPYQLARLAKEKGFVEPCLTCYNAQGNLMNDGYYSITKPASNRGNKPEYPAAPLYQQLVDWLRNKNIIIEIPLDQTSDMKFVIEIHRYLSIEEINLPENSELETRFKKVVIPQELWGYYRDYYKALETALIEALKLI